MRAAGWILLVFLLAVAKTAPAWEMPEMEYQTESQADDLAEICQYLRDNPIELNRATAEELLLIPWLSPGQALRISAYLKGKTIEDPYCLVADSIIDEETLTAILPFVYLKGKPAPRSEFRASSLWQNRWQSDGAAAPYPWQNRQRADYRRGEALRIFLQSQKDIGEKDWLDYYSGAVKWQSPSARLSAVAGDFRLSSGAGLVWGSGRAKFLYPGMMFRPAAPAKIDIPASSDEWSALRGLAVSKKSGHLSAVVAASFRRQDGRVDSLGRLQSIYTDGYHRTPAELERKGAVAEKLVIAGLGWDRGDIWWDGLGYLLKLDPPFGQMGRGGLSLSGGIHRGLGCLSWEVASDDRDRQAFCLIASAGNGNSETALLAYAYEPKLFLPRSGGYEYYGGEDEQGAAVVQSLSLPYRTKFSGLCHWFRPWSPPAVLDKGSGGYRLDFKVSNGIIDRIELWYRFRLYDRERISGQDGSGELGRELSSLHQAGLSWRLRELIKVSLGLSISRFRPAVGTRAEKGELASAGLSWSPRRSLSLSTRSSIFYTETYDARIYQTEPELKGCGSFHGFWGQGRRDAVLVRYQLDGQIWAEAKAAYTFRNYRDEVIRQTEFGLQVEGKI